MTNARPLVSFGLPVYNGEPHVRVAIESLLAQDYPNFELVICDNASTDGTDTLCRAFAARDPRVRYYRNDRNLGATRNFNRVFELARGEYFAWAGHDDHWEPTFLSRCVAALDAQPNAVMAHTWARLVDLAGKPYPFSAENFLVDGESRSDRFRAVLQDLWSPLAIYGLIRADMLRRTHLFRHVVANDRLLLAELALLGEFVAVPEALWTYRLTAFTVGAAYLDRMRKDFPGVAGIASRWAPWAVLFAAFMEVALRSQHPLDERLRFALHGGRWYAVDTVAIPRLRRVAIDLFGEETFERWRRQLRGRPWYRAFRRLDTAPDLGTTPAARR